MPGILFVLYVSSLLFLTIRYVERMNSLIDLVFDTLTNYYRTHAPEYIERVHSLILWFDLVSIHGQDLIDIGYDVMSDFTNEKMDNELINLGCINVNSPIGMDWERYDDEEGGSYYYWIDSQR